MIEQPSLDAPAEIPVRLPIFGYSAIALLLWLIRRPLLVSIALLIRMAILLVKPALLLIGTAKLVQLAQTGREKACTPLRSFEGDDEAMLLPARSVSGNQEQLTAIEM